LISLDLWVSGIHASGMKILLMMAVVQSLNLVIFAWFNRVAGMRILVLRQQLTAVCRQNFVRQQIQAVKADAGTDPYVINPGLWFPFSLASSPSSTSSSVPATV
jgi:hypothetical protein